MAPSGTRVGERYIPAMSLNVRLRRWVPSVSRLTYHPLIKRLLDLLDVIPALVYKEFRSLPPNHLRCRVGVSNRLFANQVIHLQKGVTAWMHWLANGWCDIGSDVVEIGVGCGRRAQHIRNIDFHGQRYTGSYLGIDIDREALEWCRGHFDERFEFVQSNHTSTSYVNDAAGTGGYRIPRDDASVDFVFGTSVFTHLLEEELVNYLAEGARVLRPGGRMVVSCFCIDLQPSKVGVRHSFRHRVDNAYVESLAQPEAAVAYESSFLCGTARKVGFADAEVLQQPGDVQHDLVCTK
jgi:SAM-dependent methyltransferase